MNSLVSGTFWSTLQRFGSLAIGFVSNMVLARLLCPEDFGTIGMIMVFVSIADVLVDGGLGNAIIQKKNLNAKDIDTVFTSNLFFSLFLFFLIFGIAPFIEIYTEIYNLSLYLRVQSVMILIRAFYVVPFSILNKSLGFKNLAKIGIFASLVSTVVAISLAFLGFGIWSLIFRNIILDFLLCILYIIKANSKFHIGFDCSSFRELFGFGLFVALSNIFENLYTNVISFFIGKKYSVKDLGYYNQARSLEQIPIYSLTMILNQVLFPYFSSFQDDLFRLRNTIRNGILAITFLSFPLLIFLICCGNPIIEILYSHKWLPAVPYFQILCFGGLINAPLHINRSLLKSLGYSRVIFNIQISTCFLGICLVYLGLFYSLKVAICCMVLNSLIIYIITSYFAGEKINYSFLHQIRDILPNILIALFTGFIVFFIENTLFGFIPNILLVLLVAIIYAIIYFTLHWIFRTNSIVQATIILKNIKKK